ncbi:AHH domain-containing protein [Altererythrobacter sp. CAU 1778]
MQGKAQRRRIPFGSVNRRGSAEYDPRFQRHHIVPIEIVVRPHFRAMMEHGEAAVLDFGDFRWNGMLLPGVEDACLETGLPLHRGRHRRYNAMVLERVAGIDRRFHRALRARPRGAGRQAAAELRALTQALRLQLLSPPVGMGLLNSICPIGTGRDFSELDAMADRIWGATAPTEAD